MENIRTFIAIELPDSIRQKLNEVESALKTGKTRAKWVSPESIHLTLKFLGGISPDTIAGITAVMEEAAAGVSPFQLAVSGLGVFPDERRVRVVWAGVGGDMQLLVDLQKRLDNGLEKLGFVPESRPFTPHLTLARIRDEASASERQSMAGLVESTVFEGGEFAVDGINLMKSDLRREGAVYSKLAVVPLPG